MAAPIAKRQAWDRLRNFLIREGFRAGDFLEQGPSGNTGIDESKIPPRETDEELRERMREALRREVGKLIK